MNQLLKYSILTMILLVCTPVSWSRDRKAISYHIASGSRLWISGSATLGSYECETVAVFGSGDVDTTDLTDRLFTSRPAQQGNSVKLNVIVKFFDCGNPIMNSDMYSALKADKDSIIHFNLVDSYVVYDSISEKGRLGLHAIGQLTIAGISRLDTIDIEIRTLKDKKFEILGQKKLSMIDFDITPPTALFGLIKAHENLTVHFDLIAAPVDEVDTDNRISTLIKSE